MIRKLFLLTIIGIVGAAAVGDNMARVYAEHQIEQRADAYFEHTNGSSAHISSFPFVVNLLASGEVKHLDVSVYGATMERLFFRRITLKFGGLKLDRAKLFKKKVRLKDLKSGTVQVDVDGRSFATRIGRDVRFKKGVVEVHQQVAGGDVFATGSLTIADNVVTFHPQRVQGINLPGGAAQFGFTYRLPRSDLFPCAATVEPIDGGLLAGCTINKIPPGLVGDISAQIQR